MPKASQRAIPDKPAGRAAAVDKRAHATQGIAAGQGGSPVQRATIGLCIGIDAGGTATQALVRHSDGTPDVALLAKGANVMRHGKAHVSNVLTSLLRTALEAAPLEAVVAGVAGAGNAHTQHWLADSIRVQLGAHAPAVLEVVHDGVIALEAAFPGGSGMLMIAGTGSGVVARTVDGVLARAGGWGYRFGDEGSGYALGRKGVAAAAHALDGGPATTIQARIASQHGYHDRAALISAVYEAHWPLQQVAPLVLGAAQNGDAVAQRIVREEVQALARQALWLHQRTRNIDPRVSLTGGLSRSSYYVDETAHALAHLLPTCRLSRLEQPNTFGALSLAGRLAAGAIAPGALRVTDSGD